MVNENGLGEYPTTFVEPLFLVEGPREYDPLGEDALPEITVEIYEGRELKDTRFFNSMEEAEDAFNTYINYLRVNGNPRKLYIGKPVVSYDWI